MYRHIVLFRIHDGVGDAEVSDAVAHLRNLGSLPGVQGWIVEPSRDARKGRVIVEDATFADETAFERFRSDPRHVEAGRRMARIADWWNGDYVVSEQVESD